MKRALLPILVILVLALAGLNLYQGTRGGFWVPDQRVADRFNIVWSNGAWSENAWFGIQTLQNPMDVWITQEIISEVRPDAIVEAGTHMGGSAALWASIAEEVNPNARIITIDIENKAQAARKLEISKRRVDFLLGSSTSPIIIDKVAKMVEGKRTLVILDSAHSKEHVLNELRAYSPMVPVGSYIIVQDGAVNGHPAWPDYGPGPYEATEAFLSENDDFVSDRKRERFMMTSNPIGYLRRIK